MEESIHGLFWISEVETRFWEHKQLEFLLIPLFSVFPQNRKGLKFKNKLKDIVMDASKT